MRRPVFAANWKLNHGPTEARAFIAAFTAKWSPRTDRTVIFFPPALSLSAVTSALANRTDISVGVQNIWFEDKGAFTGENSAPMARDAGARYVLVGHSERRHIFGETDDETARKCAAAIRNGLTPILCVGELLGEREQGITNEVVLRQLRAGLSGLDAEVVDRVAIAYEPVWAIGTGKTATPADASAVHAVIGAALRERFANAPELPPILYGGSVNSANCSGLCSADWVDGLLVGGASLDVETWTSICRT
jgi:triosephosphate isomerase